MNETPREPVMVWQFMRRHFMRIVISAVLAVVIYVAVSIYATYQREQRIAKEIESNGGHVEFLYIGPDWIPHSEEGIFSFLDRIQNVNLNNTQVTDAGLEHLKGLTNLEWLDVGDTQVTDAGLEHLRGLTKLREVNLCNTQVTDAGLDHLKGLTNLVWLFLVNTQVTAEGRASLRNTLPNCWVTPND